MCVYVSVSMSMICKVYLDQWNYTRNWIQWKLGNELELFDLDITWIHPKKKPTPKQWNKNPGFKIEFKSILFEYNFFFTATKVARHRICEWDLKWSHKWRLNWYLFGVVLIPKLPEITGQWVNYILACTNSNYKVITMFISLNKWRKLHKHRVYSSSKWLRWMLLLCDFTF